MNNVIQLHPGLKTERNKPYFVMPHEGRYVVARAVYPGSAQHTVVEDCRTARFAQAVADNYNADVGHSPTLASQYGTQYSDQR